MQLCCRRTVPAGSHEWAARPSTGRRDHVVGRCGPVADGLGVVSVWLGP
ncbi:hypothetical protein TOK_6046 [Pseudonocardia sp. N23]|nr:hypothetical protein TOK_6046 [Pseudonocardia sp. N23]